MESLVRFPDITSIVNQKFVMYIINVFIMYIINLFIMYIQFSKNRQYSFLFSCVDFEDRILVNSLQYSAVRSYSLSQSEVDWRW